MHIKSLKFFSHENRTYSPGGIYEVTDAIGEKFVRIGHAVAAKENDTDEQVKPAGVVRVGEAEDKPKSKKK